MEYRVVTKGDVVRVELTGEMTYENLDRASEELLNAVREKPGSLVLDLSGVSYISEDGMALIVLMYRDAVCRGVQIYLEGARGAAGDRIHRAGLDQFLKPPPP